MLDNFIKKNFIEKFNEAKPAGAGALAPRPGHYFIVDAEFKEVGVHGLVPIAQVNWKPAEQDFFYSDIMHPIALSGFYNENGERISDAEIFVLKGKTVSIYDVNVVYVIDTKTKPTLKYKWALLETKFPFKTTSQAVLESFFGSATNINEAHQNFVENASYDIAAAEEFEAMDDMTGYDCLDDDGYDDYSDDDIDPVSAEPNQT